MIDDAYKYDSVAVAKYIVASANEKRYVINMTKLQKLLYIAYGTYLAITGERLTNEHPQAWPYGPVFPKTRSRLLKVNLYDINLSDNSIEDIGHNEEMKSLVDIVLSTYGDKNATTLSEWSHQLGSPWDKTVNTNGFKWGDRIPDKYISEYFNSIIKKGNGSKE